MEIGLRVPLEGEVVARGRGRPAGAAAGRRRPRAAGRRAHARAARRRAGRRARPPARRRSTSARCASRTSRRSPSRSGDDRLDVPGPALVETVVKVARSASRDETRPVLTGILVSAGEQELRMVATDSYRLAVKETQLEAPLDARVRGQRAGAGAAGADAHRPARRTPSGSRSRCAPNQVVFEAAGVVLSSRLIDGQFPNVPPAAARGLRARAAARRRARSPTSCAASRCWRRRTRRCG